MKDKEILELKAKIRKEAADHDLVNAFADILELNDESINNSISFAIYLTIKEELNHEN